MTFAVLAAPNRYFDAEHFHVKRAINPFMDSIGKRSHDPNFLRFNPLKPRYYEVFDDKPTVKRTPLVFVPVYVSK
uniref:Uncharacterized protein n=1 Tax=Panagrolaimus sp. JU765 TaxID=591449 RepID=A0AC34Q6E8_9BILA